MRRGEWRGRAEETRSDLTGTQVAVATAWQARFARSSFSATPLVEGYCPWPRASPKRRWRKRQTLVDADVKPQNCWRDECRFGAQLRLWVAAVWRIVSVQRE